MTGKLEQLDVLIGDWTSSSKTYPEGRGLMKVAPTEDGKFVRIESRIEDERFPVSTQIIGGDDASDDFTVLYYDSRGVHRVYHTMVAGGVWKLWREAPGFNQRYTGQIGDDRRTIKGQWEVSEDGINWKIDFDIDYTKVG